MPAWGDIIYCGATHWENLPAGISGQMLRSNGAGADPSWATPTTVADISAAIATSVTLLPDTSTRNLITSQGDVPAIILRASNGQAVDLWQTQDFSGNPGPSVTAGLDLKLSARNLITDTTTGTKIGTGTTQKLGFYNAAPVAQIGGAIDLLAGLVTLGLRAASSNPPLNLGSGALTCGAATVSSITSPGAGATSEHFGASSATAGQFGTAVGNSASAGGSSSTAIGQNSSAAGASGTALGGNAAATGSSTVAIGRQSVANNTACIVIGQSATQSNATNNQCVIGGSGAAGNHIADLYVGGGITDTAPTNIVYHATGGSGTDIAGASLTLAGGKGTGAGVGGDVIFQSTYAGGNGTTLRTLHELARISSLGVVSLTQLTSVQDRTVCDLTPSWATSTDASRAARAVINIWDTAAREALRVEANGSAAMIGFLGATASARTAITGSRGGNAALASLLTELAAKGLVIDSTTA